MNRLILSILVIAFLLSLAGCGAPEPKPGHYAGTNPDVSFDLEQIPNIGAKSLFKLYNFNLIVPPIKIGDVYYPVSLGADGVLVKSDGSIGPENTTGVTGKINGDVASGRYTVEVEYVESRVNGVFIDWIQVPQPVQFDVNWTATLGGSLPTATPYPTAIPPKLGHYVGQDVSFEVTTSGVENLVSRIKVSDSYGCPVRSEPVLEIDSHGLFSVTDTSNVTFFGVINGESVVGKWEFTGACAVYCEPGFLCSYDPNAAYDDGVWYAEWVGPVVLEVEVSP